MKLRYDLGLGVPIGDVFGDELKVKDGGGQIAFKRQVGDAEGDSKFFQSHRDIDAKRLL